MRLGCAGLECDAHALNNLRSMITHHMAANNSVRDIIHHQLHGDPVGAAAQRLQHWFKV